MLAAKWVKLILNWTNHQWSHNGGNEPAKSDALSILDEVKAGKNFRCVEYGIVSAAALNSIGLNARVIGLKTKDVEKVKSGAGHVAAEVYLSDLKKWVFLDPQFNVIPVLNNIPLNAVEFQKAIMEKTSDLKLVNVNGEVSAHEKQKYLNFAAKYLYYFDTFFDCRRGQNNEPEKINGKTKLTLVPVDAKEPKIFQRKHPINYSEYTNSIRDFYAAPEITLR